MVHGAKIRTKNPYSEQLTSQSIGNSCTSLNLVAPQSIFSEQTKQSNIRHGNWKN